MIEGKDKFLAILAHVGYIFLGVGFVLIPLAIYLFFDGKNEFVAAHARQALKAQALVGIVGFIVTVLTFFVIGIVLWPVIIVIAIVLFICSFIACLKAINGKEYRYPLL